MISIMVCRLKELDTSALSVSPRRLTEGVLEGEGPTSADAGVASCLLFDTQPVFRRLRDDFWDGKISVVGMRRLGGIELQKGGPWECSLNSGAFAAQRETETSRWKCGGILEAVRHSSTARLSGGHSWHENDTGETSQQQKDFLSNNHQTSRP